MKKLCGFLVIIYMSVSIAYGITNNSLVPIGDGIHVEVYTFIVDALQKTPNSSSKFKETMKKEEIQNVNNKDWKNHISNVYEGELSGLLRILCQTYPQCYDITLYEKNGIAIATSGIKNNKIFKKRPLDFTIGILDTASLKLGTYAYMESNKKYIEVLKAIYVDKNNHGYVELKRRNTQDILIGYVSWVIFLH